MLNDKASSVLQQAKKKKKKLTEIERLHAPKALRSQCVGLEALQATSIALQY